MSAEAPPFFSVCLPVTNRGTTIFTALTSVGRQSCRDFELIVVDCGSTDNSRSEIERYFDSDEYSNNRFPYRYERRDYTPKTVEDWNEPVVLARGRYIAMLEGDDQFLSQHLKAAYEILSSNPTVGIYATGNQIKRRGEQGLLPARDAALFIYRQTEVPPPSEAIFIRTDHNGEPFLYNDQEYEYAPEVDLYIRIALAGYRAFFASTQYTLRDISPKNRTTWHYFHDSFVIAQKYAPVFGPGLQKELSQRLLQSAVTASLVSRSPRNFRDIGRRLLRIAGPVGYLSALAATVRHAIRKRIKPRSN